VSHLTPTLIALLLVGCAARPAVSRGEERLAEQPGTIVQVGTFGYGIVPDADPGTRYAPEGLPRELEVDGIKVLFAGVLSSPPPGARVWGVPLRLTSIRRSP